MNVHGTVKFFRSIGLVVAAALSLCSFAGRPGASEPPPEDRPNFVFILVDDLGWADVGAFSSRFYDTPHIDRLTQQSMSFTAAYAAAPVCSPTRASLMTGKSPARLHITDWIPGQGNRPTRQLRQVEDRDHLPLEEVTVAEALQEVGYRTGYIGKWHLGGGPGHLPTDQGFGVNVAGYDRGNPAPFGGYFSPWDNPYLNVEAEGQYLPDRMGREAARFIRENSRSSEPQPFFLQLSFYSVHTPLQAEAETIEKYQARADSLPFGTEIISGREHGNRTRIVQSNPTYAAMVEAMDRNVGRLLSTLKETGTAENTVVVLFSDNGGLSVLRRNDIPPTSNRPLRAGKGWLYEGGIRVPLVVRWPGVTEPGSTSNTPVSSIDLLPTLLEIAGAERPESTEIDGESLVPLLRREGKLNREALYWHYPHYHGAGATPSGAIRKGRYKLIEYFEDGTTELYDLKADLSEANDLAEERPEKARALLQQLEQWRRRVGAQMPKPNPNYSGK